MSLRLSRYDAHQLVRRGAAAGALSWATLPPLVANGTITDPGSQIIYSSAQDFSLPKTATIICEFVDIFSRFRVINSNFPIQYVWLYVYIRAMGRTPAGTWAELASVVARAQLGATYNALGIASSAIAIGAPRTWDADRVRLHIVADWPTILNGFIELDAEATWSRLATFAGEFST